jgi:hypothetical protein
LAGERGGGKGRRGRGKVVMRLGASWFLLEERRGVEGGGGRGREGERRGERERERGRESTSK